MMRTALALLALALGVDGFATKASPLGALRRASAPASLTMDANAVTEVGLRAPPCPAVARVKKNGAAPRSPSTASTGATRGSGSSGRSGTRRSSTRSRTGPRRPASRSASSRRTSSRPRSPGPGSCPPRRASSPSRAASTPSSASAPSSRARRCTSSARPAPLRRTAVARRDIHLSPFPRATAGTSPSPSPRDSCPSSSRRRCPARSAS